jgi:hypothetical protein
MLRLPNCDVQEIVAVAHAMSQDVTFVYAVYGALPMSTEVGSVRAISPVTRRAPPDSRP